MSRRTPPPRLSVLEPGRRRSARRFPAFLAVAVVLAAVAVTVFLTLH